METSKRSIGRIHYFDYLRVFATFAVIVIHVAAYKFGSVDVKSFSFFVFNAFDSLARWSVPIFVMISGALFLNKDINFSKLFKKNILRLITAYLFWSVLYAVILTFNNVVVKSGQFNIHNFLSMIIGGHYHMWFIPMIIGLYLSLPVLQPLKGQNKTMKYFILLSFIFAAVIPLVFNLVDDFAGTFAEITSIKNVILNMKFYLVLGFVGYFVAGYYLQKNELSKTVIKTIYALGIISFIASILLNFAVSVKTGAGRETYIGFTTVFVSIESAAVFLFFKNCKVFKNPGKFVQTLSKLSFGVYLLHPLIIELLDNVLHISTTSFNPLLSVPVISVAVFIVSSAAIYVLSKLPLLNKYII